MNVKTETKFIVVVGLPGSGKTTLAKTLNDEIPNSVLLDDFSMNPAEYVKLFAESNADTVIITDPRMCGASETGIIETITKCFNKHIINPVFDFTYFENDPDSCLINARRSPKPRGTENFIKSYSKIYSIPVNARVYPVYKE